MSLISTKKEAEKAVLVCTTIPKSGSNRSNKQKIFKEHLDELEFLTQTAGADVVHKVYQERDNIDSSFFIGKGKAQSIADYIELNDVNLVIFENSLTPTQIRNLEKVIKRKVIDKPALILDIFAANARTAEAKTQVELAQLKYLLPRLTRQWTHFSKQYGGIGTKGPGETQIETDRRLVKTRISVLNSKLKKIEEQRKLQRQQRVNFIRISLVGYTNVGKSTLLNILTDAGVYVENKLFATLDTSTKLLKEINNVKLPHPLLISDTVGFIRNLPHDLIESFKSTLAEVVESDLLLHVIDISSENYEEQMKVVDETLADIKVNNKPVILVFNKIDLLGNEMKHTVHELGIKYPEAVFISAEKGINLNSLVFMITTKLKEYLTEEIIRIPTDNKDAYKIINQLHENFDIKEIKYQSKAAIVKLYALKSEIDKIKKLIENLKKPKKRTEVVN